MLPSVAFFSFLAGADLDVEWLCVVNAHGCFL